MIVPEDPTYNGAILQPLICRMLAECGKGNAKVDVLANPKAAGFEHAKALLPQIVERYTHYDLLLFLPDADGNDRSPAFTGLEREAAVAGVTLLCCAAVQEVEVWLLAGHPQKIGQPWHEVREDVSVKENVFEPFLEQYGDPRRPGGGRDLLMKEGLRNYDGVLQRCPELATLQARICDEVARQALAAT
jgi:hypothetical protein